MKRKKAHPLVERAKRRGEPLRVRENADRAGKDGKDDAGGKPAIRTLDLDNLELELEGIELVSDHGGYDPYDKKLTQKKPQPGPRRDR